MVKKLILEQSGKWNVNIIEALKTFGTKWNNFSKQLINFETLWKMKLKSQSCEVLKKLIKIS